MSGMMRTLKAPSVLLLVALLGVIAYGSFANRQSASVATQPPMIVWIDFGKVFEAADDVARGEQELQRINDEFEATRQQLDDEIKVLREELNNVFEPGTEEYDRAEKRLQERTIEYRAQVEFVKAKLAFERSRIRKENFDRAREEAAAFAVSNGYHYVLISDAGFDVEPGQEAQVMVDIASRRVIYAAPEYDVTDAFIKWLNKIPD